MIAFSPSFFLPRSLRFSFRRTIQCCPIFTDLAVCTLFSQALAELKGTVDLRPRNETVIPVRDTEIETLPERHNLLVARQFLFFNLTLLQVAPHSTESVPSISLAEGAIAPILQDVPVSKKRKIKKEAENNSEELVNMVGGTFCLHCFSAVVRFQDGAEHHVRSVYTQGCFGSVCFAFHHLLSISLPPSKDFEPWQGNLENNFQIVHKVVLFPFLPEIVSPEGPSWELKFCNSPSIGTKISTVTCVAAFL